MFLRSTDAFSSGEMDGSVVGSWLVLGDKLPVHERVGVGDVTADEQDIQARNAADKRVCDWIVTAYR